MKKLSLLIALALIVTIGGVYATWVYTQSTDVADITGAKAITMTEATFTGTYGTYAVDPSNLSMVVDPAVGTTHDTSLVVTGELKITFTPNEYAPEDVKENAIPSTFAFSLSNQNWQYEGQNIMTITNTEAQAISWGGPDENGVFSFVLTADQVASFLNLTVFTLDTKADYDEYDAVLTNGQIVVSISDGQHS